MARLRGKKGEGDGFGGERAGVPCMRGIEDFGFVSV